MTAYGFGFLLLHAMAATASDTSAEIDKICNPLSLLSDNHEPAEIYADLSDPYDQVAPSGWQSVPDRKKLEQLGDTKHPYTQAFVWRIERGTLVAILFESQSGDSVLNAEYCFDSATSLRRSVTTFNTFHAIDPLTDEPAPVSRVKTSYFAPDGRIVEVTTALLDLKTLEPAPSRQFMDHDDPRYMSLADLPFFSLMPK